MRRLISRERSLALAYERAAQAYCIAVAQAAGGLVLCEPDFLLTLCPFKHGSNGVISPRFEGKTLPGCLDVIREVALPFHTDVRLKLGPSTSPEDLGARLMDHGCRRLSTMRYMGLEIDRLPVVKPVAGLSIYPVTDFDAFGMVPRPYYGSRLSKMKQLKMAAFQHLADEPERHHWVIAAEKGEKFIGSAVLFFREDTVFGCEFLVNASLRRQGIGSAMLMWMVEFARDRGARLAVFNTSTMGRKFYPHFGFIYTGEFPSFVLGR